MQALLNIFYLLPLALWLGAMIFFAGIVTPQVFRTLPKEIASSFISEIFPPYYYFGYACGGLMLLSSVINSLLNKHLLIIKIVLVVMMLGCTLYAGQSILPKAHALKLELKSIEDDPSPLAEQKRALFRKFHKEAVVLNLIAMSSGLILLIRFAIKKS